MSSEKSLSTVPSACLCIPHDRSRCLQTFANFDYLAPLHLMASRDPPDRGKRSTSKGKGKATDKEHGKENDKGEGEGKGLPDPCHRVHSLQRGVGIGVIAATTQRG